MLRASRLVAAAGEGYRPGPRVWELRLPLRVGSNAPGHGVLARPPALRLLGGDFRRPRFCPGRRCEGMHEQLLRPMCEIVRGRKACRNANWGILSNTVMGGGNALYPTQWPEPTRVCSHSSCGPVGGALRLRQGRRINQRVRRRRMRPSRVVSIATWNSARIFHLCEAKNGRRDGKWARIPLRRLPKRAAKWEMSLDFHLHPPGQRGIVVVSHRGRTRHRTG